MERDFLTQLLNRAEFDARLTASLDTSRQSNEPLCVIMVDIDHFKKVNDSRGHQVGDAVLRGVAGVIAGVARSKGEAFRYGGEELAVVLPNHSAEEGLAVAERVRRAIAAQPIEGVIVTASLGVSSFPDHASNAEGIVHAADKALYDAKNRGRNLVRRYGEPEPPKPGPREPDRKVPEPGRLTEQQRIEFRRRVLRGQPITCPDDGAPFDVHDISHIGSVGREFLISCPDCGFSDHLSGGSR